AGFLVTGTSGKMRIHTRPARFMARVMARRAAAIWPAVTRSGSVAFKPKEPKFSAVPPLAWPWMRPLWALRYLVRVGCSMILCPSSLGRLGRPLGAPAALAIAAATAASPPSAAAALLGLYRALLGRRRIVLHDLALEDPHLDADHAIG